MPCCKRDRFRPEVPRPVRKMSREAKSRSRERHSAGSASSLGSEDLLATMLRAMETYGVAKADRVEAIAGDVAEFREQVANNDDKYEKRFKELESRLDQRSPWQRTPSSGGMANHSGLSPALAQTHLQEGEFVPSKSLFKGWAPMGSVRPKRISELEANAASQKLRVRLPEELKNAIRVEDLYITSWLISWRLEPPSSRNATSIVALMRDKIESEQYKIINTLVRVHAEIGPEKRPKQT